MFKHRRHRTKPISRRCRIAGQNGHRRDGIAATEFALVVPVLVLIVFATIDVLTMMRVKQRLDVIAFECARIAATPDATAVNVNFQKDLLSNEGSISGVTIQMQPSDLGSLSSGDWVQVTANASFGDNSMIGAFLFPNVDFTRTFALQRQ